MTKTHYKVFIPSGCLSLPGMISYLKGILTAKEMEMARLHIDKCRLCRETLDQMNSDHEIDAFSRSVETINKQLKDRLAADNSKQTRSNKTFKMMPLIRIAASILIALGILYYLQQVIQQNSPSRITSESMLVEEPVALNETLGASVNNRPVEYFLEEAVIRTPGDQGNQRHESRLWEHQPTATNSLKKQESITGLDHKPVDEINTGGQAKSTAGTALGSHFFNPLEAMPEFPGGYDALKFYLASQLNCQENATKENFEERIVLTFIIDEQGQPREVSIIRGIGGGCDDEAVRVIGAMPAWKPATLDGKPVSVMFTLPVKFEML